MRRSEGKRCRFDQGSTSVLTTLRAWAASPAGVSSWSRLFPGDATHGEDIARNARGRHRKLVALRLASSEAAKRWPIERYLALIHRVAAEHDVAFLAVGGPDVTSSCNWIRERVPHLVSYPGTHLSLGVLWSAISRCDLYIGNDTGFMHMATLVPVDTVVGAAMEMLRQQG